MATLIDLLSKAAYVAATLVLYTLCYGLLIPLSGLAALVFLWPWHLGAARFPALETGALGIATFTLGASVAICLSALAATPIAASLARFILRAAPVGLGVTRSEFLWKMALGLGIAVFVFWQMVYRTRTWQWSPPTDIAQDLDTSRWLVNLCMDIGTTAMWVGTALIVGKAHAKHTNGPHAPYVLFLRRFSTFADRVLIAEIIRGTPAGVHPAFIASPGGAPANWDFFTWSFAKLPILHPLRDMPLQFQTTDMWWARNVERLTQRAECVVIDETGKSASMEIERDLVKRLVAPERLVRVALSSDRSQAAVTLADETGALPILHYRKDTLAALPGIITRLGLVSLAGLFLDRFSLLFPMSLPLLGLGFAWLLLPAYASVFIIHRVIAKDDRRRIQDAIAQAVRAKPSLNIQFRS